MDQLFKDPEIDKLFKHRLKAIETPGGGCDGCIFQEAPTSWCQGIYCDDEDRADGRDVIFVEKK
jgi:hypothetical protein